MSDEMPGFPSGSTPDPAPDPALAARWDEAPCGLATLAPDGTVVDANGTLLRWLARERQDVVGRVRLPDLFSVGGRIYWETHLDPLLRVDRQFDEVALELRTPYGRLPVVVNAVLSQAGPPTTEVVLFRAWERSRYERELQAARAVAEHSATQTRALQHATAALSGALGVDGVATALLSAAVGPLGAAAATLWLSDPDVGLGPPRSRGEPAGLQPPPRMVDLVSLRTAALVNGRVLVPLHGQSSLQGVLSLVPDDDPGADALDLEVLTSVGQQAGLALDRAQLYEQSASVAHELQQSLLAIEPPDDRRYEVATAYRPGVERLEVGGDWYDVFLAAEGVLAFGVGDVVGRGLGAASAMGQLRSAVRAVSDLREGPGRLLSRLDRFVEHSEAAAMATLAYAELDLATGELRYACAGHPPPLLLPERGEPRLLWEGRSTPLGAFSRPQHRAEARMFLADGDRVLLYTDGLVERRERSLDAGLDLLRAAATGDHDLPLDAVVRRLTATMLRHEHTRDDVCLLLLAWNGGRFERHLPADLSTLSLVRTALDAWLTDRGVDPLTVRDVVLATSEALANAAEHGLGGGAENFVRLRCELLESGASRAEIVITVEDQGSWRPGQPSTERGRGLRIIRALVDDVTIQRDGGTTVVLRHTVPEVSS
jgi:serine phosphatase RsbU (regulator of sigma subunit)/anti-sigma regulatory factor (Ser/Thr protein kinase)